MPWFTVGKIDEETFVISEYGHWEETHCYLLLGKTCAVLIDTGLGVANIREVVDSLTTLPVRVLTTHVHWDHIGGHRHFDHIAVHKTENAWLSVQFPIPLDAVKHNLMCKPCDFPADFRIDDYQIYQGAPTQLLQDGDIIDLGNRQLEVVHTPGHSPGHCCFYEPERKYLYSGDLIYSGCLDAFYPTTDPVQFWHSVQKIQKLDIYRILPGHHQLEIPASMIHRVEQAFCNLAKNKQLQQGNGIFQFDGFQIHI